MCTFLDGRGESSKKVTHLLPSEKARRGDIERLKTVDCEDRVFQTFPLFKTEM